MEHTKKQIAESLISSTTASKDLNAVWKYVVPEMDPCEVGCIVTYVLAFKKDKSPESIATEICKAFMESKGGIDETK